MEKFVCPILTDFSPHRLAAAVEESIVASIPVFGIQGGYRVDSPPGVQQAITAIPAVPGNSVAGAKFEPAQADAAIEQIISDCRARGVCIDWWVGPLTQPADLGSRLAAHGFSQADNIPGMAVDLEKLNELPVPDGLTVQLARGEAGWRQWTNACLRAWEMDRALDDENEPWYKMLQAADPDVLFAYSGWLAGKPVAVSIMILGAGVAGIHFVETRKDARRKGIGARMTLEPLLEARRLGYRIGVLSASEMGFSIYRKIGFEEVCRLSLYSWEP